MKMMRELVEQEFISRFEWENQVIYYDDPRPLPDVKSMTDEELWAAFLPMASGAAIA